MDELFLSRMNRKGSNLGYAMKKQSDILLNRVFTQDADYKTGNLYDCYGNILEEDVEYKFQFARTFSITKDQVEFYVQFRPLYHPEKIYKMDDGRERLGFYLDIPDDSGQIRQWLIVGRNDKNFVRYNVLRCNWTLKYVVDGKIYEVLGVQRERNSYNSGVWSDGFVTSVENQTQFYVPTSSITNLIDYDMRFMVSDNPIHPLVYQVSKREDTTPLGITKLTLVQDHYDSHRDNIELGVCDYYDMKLEATPLECPPIKAVAKASGQVLYIGGSSRTITVTLFDEDDQVIEHGDFVWSFKLNGEDIELSDLIGYEINTDENTLSIKADNDFTLIGQLLEFIVQDSDGNTLTSVKMEVRR